MQRNTTKSGKLDQSYQSNFYSSHNQYSSMDIKHGTKSAVSFYSKNT